MFDTDMLPIGTPVMIRNDDTALQDAGLEVLLEDPDFFTRVYQISGYNNGWYMLNDDDFDDLSFPETLLLIQ